MLVDIDVKDLKAAAAKLPPATKESPRTGIDAGIEKGAANNTGGKVTSSDITANRVRQLIGVSAETGPGSTDQTQGQAEGFADAKAEADRLQSEADAEALEQANAEAAEDPAEDTAESAT